MKVQLVDSPERFGASLTVVDGHRLRGAEGSRVHVGLQGVGSPGIPGGAQFWSLTHFYFVYDFLRLQLTKN